MENETKKCPHCGGEINAKAKKCIHCKRWLEEPASEDVQNVDTSAKQESTCPESDPAAVHQQSPPPVPNQHSAEVSPNPYKQKIQFGEVFKETYIVTFKNIGWLFLTSLLYLITVWIPYLNIGTTIAMFNLPIVLARKESVNPLFIFDAECKAVYLIT